MILKIGKIVLILSYLVGFHIQLCGVVCFWGGCDLSWTKYILVWFFYVFVEIWSLFISVHQWPWSLHIMCVAFY